MKLFEEPALRLAHEFNEFLDYVVNKGVKLSPKTFAIGRKDCFLLDQRLTIVKEAVPNKNRNQMYYVTIDFFYYFALKLNILRIAKRRGTGLSFEPGIKYQQFLGLSAIEKYILMASVGLSDYCTANRYDHQLLDLTSLYRNRERFANEYFERYYVQCRCEFLSVIRLLALFSLIKIRWLDNDEIDPDNKYRIKNISLTAQGELYINKHDWQYHDNMQRLIELLASITCQDNQKTVVDLLKFCTVPKETRNLTLLIELKHGPCVRNIYISNQDTLANLHRLIMQCVDFDGAHLHCFKVGHGALQKVYYSNDSYKATDTDKTKIAGLEIFEGMDFVYVFDFGDMWHFYLKIKKIIEQPCFKPYFEVVKGENPVQYYDWEDDYE